MRYLIKCPQRSSKNVLIQLDILIRPTVLSQRSDLVKRKEANSFSRNKILNRRYFTISNSVLYNPLQPKRPRKEHFLQADNIIFRDKLQYLHKSLLFVIVLVSLDGRWP